MCDAMFSDVEYRLMRYSEKKFDLKADNPIALIVLAVYTLVSAPIRLMSEIAKKIIFLREKASKFLLLSIVTNTIVIIYVVLTDVFIHKKINMTSGKLSIGSLVVSFIFCIIMNFIFSKYKVDLYEDEETVEEENTLDDIIEEVKPSVLHTNSQIEDQMKEGSTLTEALEDLSNSGEEVDSLELSDVIKRTEKEKIDSVYEEEFEVKYKKLGTYLKRKNYEEVSDLEERERAYLEDDSDLEELTSKLGLPTEIKDTFDFSDEESGAAKCEEIFRRRRMSASREHSDTEELLNMF